MSKSVTDHLTELKKDITASLYIIPATFEELMERDFLKTTSEYGVSRILHSLYYDGWIYMRGEKYYTYKKIALSKEMSDYELG